MPITFLDLAVHRGAKRQEDQTGINGAEFERVGLQIMGGCEVCGASLAAYNGYPAKSGYWRCSHDIGNEGFETVEEANRFIFGANEREELGDVVQVHDSQIRVGMIGETDHIFNGKGFIVIREGDQEIGPMNVGELVCLINSLTDVAQTAIYG